MNINDLKLFKSICETRNYTQTSKIFFISQPAVTAAINRMEEELKTTLFKRTRFKQDVTLTQTGRLFETHVDQILKQLNEAYTEIRTFERLKTVNLGLPPIIGAYYFPQAVSRLVQEHILSSLKIVEEEGSQRMLSRVLSEVVDIALMSSLDRSFSHEGVSAVHLASYPFKAIVSRNHPLAVRSSVRFSEIRNDSFISLKPDFLHYDFLVRLFKRHHAPLSIVSRTNQIQTFKSLVASGAGIGLIAGLAVDPKTDDVVTLELDEPDVPEFNVFLCYLKGHEQAELTSRLIEILSHVQIADKTDA